MMKLLRKYKSLMIGSLMPLVFMPVLYGACMLVRVVTGSAEAERKAAFIVCMAGLAALPLLLIALMIIKKRGVMEKCEKPLGFIFGIVLCDVAEAGLLSAVLDVGTMFDAMMVTLMLYAVIFVVLALAFAINRAQNARFRRETSAKEQNDAWYRERYGAAEENECVAIDFTDEETDSADHAECLRLLGGEPDEDVNLLDSLVRLAERGLILWLSRETALCAELLRMAVCRLCENLGIDASVTAEELAAELERCDTPQLRSRRDDGLATFAHDANAIDRILRRRGCAVVLIDYGTALAVVSTENADRIAQLAAGSASEND